MRAIELSQLNASNSILYLYVSTYLYKKYQILTFKYNREGLITYYIMFLLKHN